MTSHGPGGGNLEGDSFMDYVLLFACLAGPAAFCAHMLRWLWQNT